MSITTKISWADSTASPWFGCTEVSPGCVNCYARELTLKRGWAGWGDSAPRVRSKGFWKEVRRWNRQAVPVGKNHPLYPVVRPRIFPSLMDWLDPKVPIEWLADFMKVIHDCPNLDFLLLTKRPELFHNRIWEVLNNGVPQSMHLWLLGWADLNDAPKNVWIGVTCEDQERADQRIPELLKIPAKMRFLSVEPLLEPVDLPLDNRDGPDLGHCAFIDWVIVGGESGPNRRDCGVGAILDVAQQCVKADVPVFVKQDCAFKPGQQGRIPDCVWKFKEVPTK